VRRLEEATVVHFEPDDITAIDLNFRERLINETTIRHKFRVFTDVHRIRRLWRNKIFWKFHRKLIYRGYRQEDKH